MYLFYIEVLLLCQALIVYLSLFYITYYFIFLGEIFIFRSVYIYYNNTNHLSKISISRISPALAHIQKNWSNITSLFNVVCKLSDRYLFELEDIR